MGIILGIILTLAVAALVGYPLFKGGSSTFLEGRAAPTGLNDEVDRSIEERVSRARHAPAAGAGSRPKCPRCGSRYKPGDRFCADCGADLGKGGRK